MMTFQIFVGHCKEPTLAVENRSQPNIRFPQPVLLEHVRHLELSLPPSFEHALPCSSSSFPGETIKAEDLHDAFDFHWLRLDKFQNLRSINIWMAARAMLMHYVPPNSRDPVFVSITSLNIESLRRPLASFGGSFEVTLSMPLHKDITPEDGFVEGIAPSNVRLWKRGSGDQYHPLMLPSGPGGIWYGKIFAAQRRYVHIHPYVQARRKWMEIFMLICPLLGS